MKNYNLHFSKRCCTLGFALAMLFGLLLHKQVEAQTTDTYNFTGAMQTFTVPPGVTSVFIQTWGAQGGTGTNSNPGSGGQGGYAQGNLAVIPGQVLNIFVGGQGAAPAAGFNGGGTGGGGVGFDGGAGAIGNGGGGGGASDVRVGGTALADRVIVAGGGGGGGANGCFAPHMGGNGGTGGGGNGGNGVNSPSGGGGFGGTLGAGGAAGIGCAGFLGMAGSNTGTGGNGQGCCCQAIPAGGGGGGGFVQGGGGGGGSAGTTGCQFNDKGGGGGGGGGSNYTGGVTSGTTNNGLRPGNGQVAITYTINPLTCPVDLTVAACQTQAAVDAAYTAWVQSAQIEAGCNGGVLTVNQGAPPACGGTSVATFTLTGNSCSPATPVTCTANFTVAFPPDLVITSCPPGSNLGCNITGVPPPGTPTFTGNCGTATIISSLGPITSDGCGRFQTRTYTVIDACNRSQTCTQVFSWTVDVTPPTFTFCPPGADLGCNPTGVPAPGAATATDACGAPTITSVLGPITSNGCDRTQTRTYTATDGCQNSATCLQVFTWKVTTPITLNCPAPQTTAACLTQQEVDSLFATWLSTATSSGGCNVVITNNSNSGTLGAPNRCGGSRTITFTANGDCQSTTTCTSTFTVPVPPTVVLTCPINTTVASCQSQAAINAQFAAWLNTVSASGGCSGVLTNNNQGAPSACGGNTVVTFTYNSSCSPSTTTCTATFTVAAPPTVVLACPINTTVASCQTQAAINAQFSAWLASASASGGCNGVLTNNNIGAPSNCGGNTVVTFIYTSTCSPFTTTCTATFTVAAPPTVVLTCPAPRTVGPCLTQAQLNTEYADWLASVSASGGCSGFITNNSPGAPLICNLAGSTTTVTFTYASGCFPFSTSCNSTFTVQPYPLFTVPANTASTVACPALIVQPTPPTVVDGCGKTLTPTGPVIVNNPNPITCEGTRTFTWTYTDCAGTVRTWSHVTTVERLPFTVPANGGATVACPAQTDLQPTPPLVTSNCGEVLTPVISSTAKPGCEGNRNWNFVYTDCEGNTATWTFIYTVEYLDFAVPASVVSAVECPLNAFEPTPPVVNDNCGKLLTAVGPTITSTDNAQGCEGSRRYSWTYADCEGNTHVWSQTFNFLYLADFTAPTDEESYVVCLAYAVPPVPQLLYDICAQPLKISGPSITEDISVSGCKGWRKYAYVYTDCGGHSHPWNFTYYIDDNQGPLGTCPSGTTGSGTVAVNVSNLSCIEEVPCPADYDFTDKIEDLLEAGNYFDVCDGANVVVTLDSWSDLWQCSDPDGDGIYTFGRTYYFHIADQCGNEYSDLCSVTYSGACLPLETFPQSAWGVSGGTPGSSVSMATTDLQVITSLLNTPLTVGGGNRSLTVDQAQCIVDLLPGMGLPGVLGNCNQVNCTGCNPMGLGGMKNALAANAITLTLNMRYNVQYNGLTMANIRNQSLNCINVHPCIYYCNASGADCKLRVFDDQGQAFEYPYTIGGLLDLANFYLGGNLSLSTGQSVLYSTAINQSLLDVNANWDEAQTATACDPNASAAPLEDGNKSLPTAKESNKGSLDFSLAPNPAGSEVQFVLAILDDAKEVQFELYNSFGQMLLHREFGNVASVSERIDLSGIGGGFYVVRVVVGNESFDKKLIIHKN